MNRVSAAIAVGNAVQPLLAADTLADLPPELAEPLFARIRQVSAAMAPALDADGCSPGSTRR